MRYYYDRHELEELLVKAQNNYDSKKKKFDELVEAWEVKHEGLENGLYAYNFAAHLYRRHNEKNPELDFFEELLKTGKVRERSDISIKPGTKFPSLEFIEPRPGRPKDLIPPPEVVMTGREAQIALSQVEQEILVKALK